MGESGATHLVKATAYRQQRLLASAEKEYRAALKYAPNDLGLQTGAGRHALSHAALSGIHRRPEPGAAALAG